MATVGRKPIRLLYGLNGRLHQEQSFTRNLGNLKKLLKADFNSSSICHNLKALEKSMSTDKQTKKEYWIPLLSSIVAIAGILSAFLTQYYTTQATIELKKYEVTFRVTQETYAKFMMLLSDTFYLAWKPESFGDPELQESTHNLMSTYLALEPFITKKGRTKTDRRKEIWNKFGELMLFYEKVALKEIQGDLAEKRFFEHQKYFRERFLDELFGE